MRKKRKENALMRRRLWCLVLFATTRAPDAELRGLTRERLEAIVNGFREVLKRGHRSSEAFRLVERLQLDLALKLYRWVMTGCRFRVCLDPDGGWFVVLSARARLKREPC